MANTAVNGRLKCGASFEEFEYLKHAADGNNELQDCIIEQALA